MLRTENLWVKVLKGGGSLEPNRCYEPLQIVISRVPLTIQISVLANCVVFHISLSGSTHNYIWQIT